MTYPAPILNLNLANAKQLVHPAVSFSRGSAGVEFGSGGVLRYVNNSVPRFDHDPLTGICKGLMGEQAVTFLDTYSEQFDNEAWTKPGVTVAPNAISSPDGTVSADKIIETSSVGGHNLVKTASTNCSIPHTLSVFVKPAERKRIRLLFDKDAGYTDICRCDFLLDTKTVLNATNSGTASGAAGFIHDYGNGWYRCVLVGTPSTSAGSILRAIVYLDDGSGGYDYAGSTSSGLYIWGAKIYAGTGPTSYLPTVASGVTRAADVCSVDLTKLTRNGSPLWTGTEGTIVVDGELLDEAVASTYLPIIVLDDGTSYNGIGIYRNGSSKQIYATMRVGSVEQLTALASIGAVEKNTMFKAVFAFSVNNSGFSLSGGTPVLDLSCSVPTGLTTLRLCRSSAANAGARVIRSVQLYNRRIDDSYLPALSAL